MSQFSGFIPACLDAYSFLVTKLLVLSHEGVQAKRRQGESAFEARNSTQLFLAHTMALAYAEVSGLA